MEKCLLSEHCLLFLFPLYAKHLYKSCEKTQKTKFLKKQLIFIKPLLFAAFLTTDFVDIISLETHCDH